jgi:thiol-disulfide isomerase/thioredoxin
MRLILAFSVLSLGPVAGHTVVASTSLELLNTSNSETRTVQSNVEGQVLKRVNKKIKETGGRVTFSELYNSPNLETDERQFLGRLYEIFFKIPVFLEAHFSVSGDLPTRQQIGDNFGITEKSVDLLLAVMEMDSRVPQLFNRDPVTKEIISIHKTNIEAFMSRHGHSVQFSWEGKRLPAFKLSRVDLQGAISSEQLKNKISLVYFWFSGCPPCIRITPHLVELGAEYGKNGFQVIGINADRVLGIPRTREAQMAYLREAGVNYPNVILTQEVQDYFGNVNVYPTLFFVGPNLEIEAHMINYQELGTLKAVVEGLVGRPE